MLNKKRYFFMDIFLDFVDTENLGGVVLVISDAISKNGIFDMTDPLGTILLAENKLCLEAVLPVRLVVVVTMGKDPWL